MGLQGAIPGILALKLITREKTVGSLLGIMGQGQGKPREGVCKVYLMDNLVTLPVGCDMVALQEFDILKAVAGRVRPHPNTNPDGVHFLLASMQAWMGVADMTRGRLSAAEGLVWYQLQRNNPNTPFESVLPHV